VSVLVLAVVAAGLVALGPRAEAAPVFVRASLDAGGGVYVDSTDCETEDSSSPYVEGLEIMENGPAATAQRSSAATTTYTPSPDDAMNSSSAVTGTGKVTSVGTDLASIDFDARATASLAPSSATSACRVWSSSYVLMQAEFVVTRGGFLTVRTSNRGDLYTSFAVGSGSDKREAVSYKDQRFSTEAEGMDVDETATVYLPPGQYTAHLEASVEAHGNAAQSLTGTGSTHATFAVAGSQTMAASGKGKRYVTFPAARSCDSHSLAPQITGKGKRAKRIKQVAFLVNDTVVKRVRTPDRGETVMVPVGDEQGGHVRAVVKLFPTRHGKPGKVVEVSAGYAPCS
jgi:hypothetical protein